MLSTLIIRNYVLIDTLHIDFAAGFSVITGETGAGKSILLGAIGLLMGHKAEGNVIRPGSDRCIIEAHFERVDSMITCILASEEIELDSDELIIRREISNKGKNRAFVNDHLASLALLKRLSEYLIDIHSQHKNLLLGDASFQLSVLDLYSYNAEKLDSYGNTYRQYKDALRKLDALKESLEDLHREQDYLQYQFDQLYDANLRSDELEELREEERQLIHAQDIQDGLSKAFEIFDHDEHGVLRGVVRAFEALNNIRDYFAEAGELADRVHDVRIELRDICQILDRNQDRNESDPNRLAHISERLDLINTLLRKHGVETIADLLERQAEIEGKLLSINTSDAVIDNLEREATTLYDKALAQAEELHSIRVKAAQDITQDLLEGLRELGMPHVRLKVEVYRRNDLSNKGIDQVEILFSANNEISLEPVASIASGGEISRLMLCIKALVADKRQLPTIIFDEIDTGVSGDIADKIGSILKRMGHNMQVMAVTHLPQIAASGNQHFYIYKEHSSESTRSHIRLLNEQERIEEIARMQSGSKLTEVSLAAAKELLKYAQQS